MKTATFVRKLDGFRGDARLFRLSEPLEGYDQVIVSAVIVPYTGAETYIFGTRDGKEVDSWSDLPGSFRGSLDHIEALHEAGYVVEDFPVGSVE